MAQIEMSSTEALYRKLKGYSKNTINQFAILKVAFENETIALLYEKYIEKHNKSILTNPYCDSGFDLYVPENVVFDKEFESKFIDMKLKVEMLHCDVTRDTITPAGFYLYPRSSISKTPLMLANHVGIIDSGYRGSVIGAFRCLYSSNVHAHSKYAVESGTRLLQICHPSLCPIYIQVVSDASELSNTERGSGGFGSTGGTVGSVAP